jgi:hypothetical protein
VPGGPVADPPGNAGTNYTLANTSATGTPAYYLYSPPRYPDPGTGVSVYTPGQGTPPMNGYTNVWDPKVAPTIIPMLQCPSDPSSTMNTYATRGLVFVGWPDPTGALPKGQSWGATNYVANWNAITNRNAFLGWQAPPNQIGLITDGTSNTIMLSEAYSWCSGPTYISSTGSLTDVRGRSAFLAFQNQGPNTTGLGSHNFGLTATGNQAQIVKQVTGLPTSTTTVTVKQGTIVVNGATTSATTNNGVPNPICPNDTLLNASTGVTVSPAAIPATGAINFGFQIRPFVAPVSGTVPTTLQNNTCNPETVQSPHNLLNVGMADGSVRNLKLPSSSAQFTAWMYLMLPSDGQAVTADY